MLELFSKNVLKKDKMLSLKLKLDKNTQYKSIVLGLIKLTTKANLPNKNVLMRLNTILNMIIKSPKEFGVVDDKSQIEDIEN